MRSSFSLPAFYDVTFYLSFSLIYFPDKMLSTFPWVILPFMFSLKKFVCFADFLFGFYFNNLSRAVWHITLIPALGIFVNLSLAWSTEQVPGQLGPHRETLSQKQ